MRQRGFFIGGPLGQNIRLSEQFIGAALYRDQLGARKPAARHRGQVIADLCDDGFGQRAIGVAVRPRLVTRAPPCA